MTTILVAMAVMTAMSAAVHHTVDTESLREKVSELERYVSELERTLDPEIDNRSIFYCIVSLLIIFGYRYIDAIGAALGMLQGVMKDIWLLASLAFESYCSVGRTALSVGSTVLSVVNRAPVSFTEILATTFVIWLGYEFFEILLFEIDTTIIRAGDNANFWQIVRDVMRPKLKQARRRSSPYGVPTDPTALPTEASIINAALEELVCPLTFELPVDPVYTEGGDVCEREAITALIRLRGMRNLRSFRTNEPISSHLVEAVAIRNVIEKLVGSGLADHEVANAWKKGREELEDRVRRNDAPSRFRSYRWGTAR